MTFGGPISEGPGVLMPHGIRKRGPGVLELKGPSTYLSHTEVTDGVLLLRHPDALATNKLMLSGIATSIGAVLGLGAGDFTRGIGENPGEFYSPTAGGPTGRIGWAAYGADRRVNIYGDSRPLTINSGGFAPAMVLAFGGLDSDGTILFENPLAMRSSTGGGANITFNVVKGIADVAVRLCAPVSNGVTTGNFIKQLGGTLELAAANTYTEPTQIYGGRLLVTGSTTAGSTVSVGNAAAGADNTGCALGGTGVIGGAITVHQGAALNLHPAAGALTATNSVTFNDNARIQIDVGPSGVNFLNFASTHSTAASRTLRFNGTTHIDLNLLPGAPMGGTITLIDWSAAANPVVTFFGGSFNKDDFVFTNPKFQGRAHVTDSKLVLAYSRPATLMFLR